MMQSRFMNWLILCLMIFPAAFSDAQERDVLDANSRVSQYHLGNENELLIPVNVWGFVGKPGQYLVPDNIDLMTLMSFAGGPTEDGKISRVKIIRSSPEFGRSVLTVNVRKFLNTADQRMIPLLKPGDTVVIKGTAFHWFTRFFEFVSRMAVVAQIFYFVALAQEYISR